MSADELRDCIATLGWTLRGLGIQLGVGESRMRRWASGLYPVPPELAEWLERLAAAHKALPPPKLRP